MKVEKTQKMIELQPVANFGSRVRKARESLYLSVEEVGKKLAITPSTINDIESEKFKPPIDIAKKLEMFFRIRLLEEVDSNSKEQKGFSFKSSNSEGPSLADLVEIKRKK